VAVIADSILSNKLSDGAYISIDNVASNFSDKKKLHRGRRVLRLSRWLSRIL